MVIAMVLRAALLRLLVGVLLLQTLLAPLQCLAYGAQRDIRTVITTEDGARSLVLNRGGDEDQDSDPVQRFSPAACATGTALPPAVPTIIVVLWLAPPSFWDDGTDPLLRVGARAPPFEATGPPSLLS